MARIRYTARDFERRHNNGRRRGDERGEFEIDRSRIIHSAAFRRLQGKTQLFAPDQSDFFRTRLTHSLEVAQVAKGIALRLGANSDLCEAAALAHDIGHPPFGHQGEKILRELTREKGGFEANAQNFRVVGVLEEKFPPPITGLDLSRALLDAIFKYKKPYEVGDLKHFYYEHDSDAEWVLAVGGKEQSFECQIMSAADDIAYAVHDFEDGLKAGIINYERAVRFREVILEEARKGKDHNLATEADVEWGLERISEGLSARASRNVTTKQLTSSLIGDFIRGMSRVPRGELARWETERYMYGLEIDPLVERRIEALKALAYVLLISDHRVSTLEVRARTILSALYTHFVSEGGVTSFPEDFRRPIERAPPEEAEARRARTATDYISGMTDDYAQRLYRRLFTAERVALLEY